MSTNQRETDQQHEREMDKVQRLTETTKRCPIIPSSRNTIKVSPRHLSSLSLAKTKRLLTYCMGKCSCIAEVSRNSAAQWGECYPMEILILRIYPMERFPRVNRGADGIITTLYCYNELFTTLFAIAKEHPKVTQKGPRREMRKWIRCTHTEAYHIGGRKGKGVCDVPIGNDLQDILWWNR